MASQSSSGTTTGQESSSSSSESSASSLNSGSGGVQWQFPHLLQVQAQTIKTQSSSSESSSPLNQQVQLLLNLLPLFFKFRIFKLAGRKQARPPQPPRFSSSSTDSSSSLASSSSSVMASSEMASSSLSSKQFRLPRVPEAGSGFIFQFFQRGEFVIFFRLVAVKLKNCKKNDAWYYMNFQNHKDLFWGNRLKKYNTECFKRHNSSKCGSNRVFREEFCRSGKRGRSGNEN